MLIVILACSGVDDPVCQPHLVRLLGAHDPARDDEVERAREPDQLRQADSAAVYQGNAKASEGKLKA